MDLRRQIVIVRARFPLFVLSVVLAAGAALVLSNLQPKIYQAKATLIVGQSLTGTSPDYNQLLASQRLSATFAAIATTRPVLEGVIHDLGLDMAADDLRAHVVAEAPVDSTLVTITVQDQDPALAASIANGVANGLIAVSPAIQGRTAELQASIEDDLKATQEQIATTQARVEVLASLTAPTAAQAGELSTLEGRLVSLRSTFTTLLGFSSGNATNQISVIEPAITPDGPVSPRTLLNVVLAALLGLVLSVGIALLVEFVRDPIKDSDDVEATLGASTLGAISRMRGEGGRSPIYQLATLLYPRSAAAEAYRTLRTNIEFASVDAPLRNLLVTSASPGEGKTVTACNLAVAFAQAGRRVLLIDADLRRPGVHVLFDLPNTQGLTSLLSSDERGVEAVAQTTEQGNLRVLTTGPLPPNPAELLGSERMRTVLERLAAGVDLMVFDSPPLRAVADAAILSSFADGTVFVVDASVSRRRAVRQGREALARAGARVLGVVLNRITGAARADHVGYYGVYGAKEEEQGGATKVGRQPG